WTFVPEPPGLGPLVSEVTAGWRCRPMAAPIIVGIDASAHAWRALDWAADHAVRRGLPVVLVHGSRALEPGGAIPDDALRRLVAERQALLDEARQYALKLH